MNTLHEAVITIVTQHEGDDGTPYPSAKVFKVEFEAKHTEDFENWVRAYPHNVHTTDYEAKETR